MKSFENRHTAPTYTRRGLLVRSGIFFAAGISAGLSIGDKLAPSTAAAIENLDISSIFESEKQHFGKKVSYDRINGKFSLTTISETIEVKPSQTAEYHVSPDIDAPITNPPHKESATVYAQRVIGSRYKTREKFKAENGKIIDIGNISVHTSNREIAVGEWLQVLTPAGEPIRNSMGKPMFIQATEAVIQEPVPPRS